jgi:hypothetical protein
MILCGQLTADFAVNKPQNYSSLIIEGTGSWGTYLTPEDMLFGYSIHYQAKA